MIAMPIGLAIILARRWKLGWRVWWIGCSTFVLSQVGHIPFNWGAGLLLNRSDLVYWPPLAQSIFNAAFLGLSAGLFEEGARYLVLQFWAKKARSWRTGIIFGAGHGGAEAIIFGLLVLVGYISMLAVGGMDLSTLVDPGQLELARQQVAAYWSLPWYNSLLGALERFFTIPVQIVMALLVMQAFTRKQIRWLSFAILYHGLVDGVVVFLQPFLSVYWLEAVVGLFALVSVALIFFLRQPEPQAELLPTTILVDLPVIKPVEETPENLDHSRYQD